MSVSYNSLVYGPEDRSPKPACPAKAG